MLDRPILGFYKQRLIFAYKSLRLVWPTLHCALLASSTDVWSSKAFYLLLDGSRDLLVGLRAHGLLEVVIL